MKVDSNSKVTLAFAAKSGTKVSLLGRTEKVDDEKLEVPLDSDLPLADAKEIGSAKIPIPIEVAWADGNKVSGTLEPSLNVEGPLIASLMKVEKGGVRVDLTKTEYDLLLFFLNSDGSVLTREALLDSVWGDRVYIEERTVDVHIRRLRLALEPSGLARLIETVRGGGYRFLPR